MGSWNTMASSGPRNRRIASGVSRRKVPQAAVPIGEPDTTRK